MKFRDIKNWSEYWKQLRETLLNPTVDAAALDASLRDARSRIPVPVLWLLGKTQAGKTSIIHALTGSETAEIGNGFQPCTRTANFYDFPADAPVVRFLDTRGLGEVAYDPGEDIRYCESQAHLLLVVMKVADLRQEAIIQVLSEIRARHPDWPVLIAQTGLHELYQPGAGHALPWPFAADPLPDSVPMDLRRALSAQREWAKRVPGSGDIRWVAIDLTLPEDGFDPPDYGLEALWAAIESLSSLGLRRLLGADPGVRDAYARAAHQHIVGYSLTAAGFGALPAVDLVAVSAVQAKLLHALAAIYQQRWDVRTVSEFLGLVGAGVATGYLGRWLGRTVGRFIPVVGQTVVAVWGASASGASTYALGKAAVYFFTRRRAGQEVDAQALRRVYAEALDAGAGLIKARFASKDGQQ
jgi:uncharacterized protein (DUF697 family)